MGLSDKLGALNYERFQAWRTPFNEKNARQAVLAFKGDVYQGLDAQSMSAGELAWAQGQSAYSFWALWPTAAPRFNAALSP